MASNGTVAQWLERRSYKSVAEGSIPSSPTFLPLLVSFSCLNLILNSTEIELWVRQVPFYYIGKHN